MHELTNIPNLAQTGVIDKSLDALFNNPPALIVFFVMILALLCIPFLMYAFVQIFQKSQSAYADNLNKLTGIITRITDSLDDSQNHANRAQEENSENYLMIKEYLNSQQESLNRIVTQTQQVVAAMAQHVIEVTTLHAETRSQIDHRLNVKIEEMLEQRRLDQFEEFTAPADDDCRFQMKLVRSAPDLTHAEILLYKAPLFKDSNEAGRLRGSGEIVRIIQETVFPGWVYIKQVYGNKPLAGYARTATVVIMELPSNPE